MTCGCGNRTQASKMFYFEFLFIDHIHHGEAYTRKNLTCISQAQRLRMEFSHASIAHTKHIISFVEKFLSS